MLIWGCWYLMESIQRGCWFNAFKVMCHVVSQLTPYSEMWPFETLWTEASGQCLLRIYRFTALGCLVKQPELDYTSVISVYPFLKTLLEFHSLQVKCFSITPAGWKSLLDHFRCCCSMICSCPSQCAFNSLFWHGLVMNAVREGRKYNWPNCCHKPGNGFCFLLSGGIGDSGLYGTCKMLFEVHT